MWFCRPLPSLPAYLEVKADSLTAHHQTKQERERPCPILQREGDFLSIRAIYTEQTHNSECVLMRNSGGDGAVEKTSLSEIHNEKMLTRCDCSMAKQWSIKTKLEERETSWCETDSERIVTGSGERERQREWTWCCVMNCGIVHSAGNPGKSLFVLSCLVKTWPLVIFLYLHNGRAVLSNILRSLDRSYIENHGYESRYELLFKFSSFCVLLWHICSRHE